VALELGLEGGRVGTGLAEQPRGEAIGLPQQRQQQVLAVDLGVPEPHRDRLGVVECFL
jgi:hypothetical protein